MQPAKKTKKHNKQQQIKQHKKTKHKSATLFFSFQSMRFFIGMDIRRKASKMGRHMHAKNTGKRAQQNVQNKC